MYIPAPSSRQKPHLNREFVMIMFVFSIVAMTDFSIAKVEICIKLPSKATAPVNLQLSIIKF